ncbi:H+/gluconate symporter-like permease [Lysinibacillus composti]|uniref:GntP family permease n=1 Tax=Lysinibacillus composti TaxID=720633 RepID=A0A3N9UDA5_9BACI|nr:GntP family permease [Lysinibacillus composti]MBM7609185.1 H+/gluconate symporter-like permease [Lysinibacillus composti]RQW74235.1 GntP family permease [Lysinibacillus composti]
MDILGILGILLGILTVILFIVKKFNIIVAAPIATIVVLLFNDVDILATVFGKESSYMTYLAGFVASNFAIFLLGSILAKYMDMGGATVSIANKILSIVGTKNPYNALVALFIISAVLTYGGINVFVIIFALVPMARPIFQQLNISWKLVIIPIFGGTSTFTMTMLPGAPSMHNIVPSNALGTSLTAGALIGIVTTIAAIIFILVFMKIVLNRSLSKNEVFESRFAEIETGKEENRELPGFFISFLPILVLLATILIFTDVPYIIYIALILAIVLSAIFFRKQIKDQKELLSLGANESVGSTITTGSTIAFGSIATGVPAFKGIFSLIQSIPGPPVLSLMVGTGLIGGITASAVGAIGISIANFVPYYLELGLDPETIHRAVAIGSVSLSIVPYSGFLLIFNKITGLTMKESFRNGFIAVCVTHWVAMAIVVIMAVMGLA